jgi:hypothetical protein
VGARVRTGTIEAVKRVWMVAMPLSMRQCRWGGAPYIQGQVVRGEAKPEELAVRRAQQVRQAKAQEWAEKQRVAKAPATAADKLAVE